MRTVVAVTAGVALLVLVGAAFALPGFSFAPRSSPARTATQAEVYDLRVACHPTFDRLVIRARLGTPGFSVRYVPRIVHDSSGLVVQLLGRRRIQVVLRPARAHTLGGRSLAPTRLRPLCPQLRQVRSAGDFEGVVTYGLGIRQLRPFRVFRLRNPTRIVVDIRH